MAEEFVLNSILSVFLDDCHDIASDLNISSLSQRDIDIQLNRILRAIEFMLTIEIVDSIAESSDVITKEEIFDPLKGFLKYLYGPVILEKILTR